MPTLRATLPYLLAIFTAGTLTAQTDNTTPVKVTSPNGQITLMLFDAAAVKDSGEQLNALRG